VRSFHFGGSCRRRGRREQAAFVPLPDGRRKAEAQSGLSASSEVSLPPLIQVTPPSLLLRALPTHGPICAFPPTSATMTLQPSPMLSRTPLTLLRPLRTLLRSLPDVVVCHDPAVRLSTSIWRRASRSRLCRRPCCRALPCRRTPLTPFRSPPTLAASGAASVAVAIVSAGARQHRRRLQRHGCGRRRESADGAMGSAAPSAASSAASPGSAAGRDQSELARGP